MTAPVIGQVVRFTDDEGVQRAAFITHVYASAATVDLTYFTRVGTTVNPRREVEFDVHGNYGTWRWAE